ncbi:hypothetical protein FFLO_06539 [Filobasidium floriforme]|uniref:Uncharacterized protein n=1 Tax=Filobasidium floriforme TaxID=5210 RepID=A0A8K0JER0_9TREE|nr:hypothetical protein FFLO_06539 [Filobasidium floriforme]
MVRPGDADLLRKSRQEIEVAARPHQPRPRRI